MDELIMEGPEWEQWKHNEQTKAFLKFLEQTVQDHQDQWLNNEYITSDHMMTLTSNAAALGAAQQVLKIVVMIEQIGAKKDDGQKPDQ